MAAKNQEVAAKSQEVTAKSQEVTAISQELAEQAATLVKKEETIESLTKQLAKKNSSSLSLLETLPGTAASSEAASSKASSGGRSNVATIGSTSSRVTNNAGTAVTITQQELMNKYNWEGIEEFVDIALSLLPGTEALSMFIESIKQGDPSTPPMEIMKDSLEHLRKFAPKKKDFCKK